MKRLLMLLLPVLAAAQTVYLPVTHPVYRYLDKMEAKQFIAGYRDEVKPLSRTDVARFLAMIDTTSLPLSDVESDEQLFFKEEFFQELTRIGYENVIEERWSLYQYQSGTALFNVNVNGGYAYRRRPDGTNTTVISNGGNVYGYVGSMIGAYFNLRDNRESGSHLDTVYRVPGVFAGTVSRPLTPEPAEAIARNLFPRSYEYDPIDAQMNLDIAGAALSVEKMHNVWGTAERGTIILSNKAPSYPQIKLRMPLGDDITFTYLHGWLHSNSMDSLRTYAVTGYGEPLTRVIFRQKYIAAHMVEFSLWDGVDIAIGESEIYGGRNPEVLYLIPFMFFKGAEHWMYDTDNSQMFMSADLNVVRDYNLYFSLFLDEFSTEDFYLSHRQRNQLAFTTGIRAYDLVMPDTRLTVEYTRLNPWVYNHKFPDATFQSHGVDLGHWLGQNGDLFFIQAQWQPMRSMTLAIQFESLRKGWKDSTVRQYQLPTPDFLYGPRTKSQSLGLTARYEVLRDLFADLWIQRSRYTSEADRGTADYAGEFDLFFSLRYNFY
ncbi:MAG: hypothetical protein F9K22_03215 [Bacteroidetes bacterium]|nr:MAG: hypothetical protein F9K22_03215 [Bacteroidota bacterium]